MSSHLDTYLNDHLAGAVAAIEMLDHLADKHAGRVDSEAVLRIKAEVEADRATLESLIQRLGARESRARQTVGWLADRFARFKVAVDDLGNGDFRAFEMLEVISLGVDGKVALWNALAAVAPTDPVLSGVDYSQLIARGRSQRAALEQLRELAAQVALRSGRPR